MGNLHRRKRKERRLGRRAAEEAWDAYERGDLERAERLIRGALRGHEGDCVLWHDLGVFLWKRGKPREAEKAFRNALVLKPAYEDAKMQLAALLADRGFYHQACRVLEELLEGRTERRELHERRLQEYRRAAESL